MLWHWYGILDHKFEVFLIFFRIIDDNNFSYFVPLFLKLQVTVIIFTYNWNSLIDIIIIKTKVHLP